MRVNQRKAGILLNYLSEGIRVITALVYTPLMLRILGQSEYGLYQLVSSLVSYLGLLSFGFGSAYIRYYARYQAQGDGKGVARLNGMFLIIFSAMSAVCLVCGGVLMQNAKLVFGNGLTAAELRTAKVLLAILIVNMALTFPGSVFDCYVAAHERFLFQKLLRVVQSVLNPFLTLPLLLMGYGSASVVLVSLGLTAAVFFANVFYCRNRLKMVFSFRKLRFSLLREMWVFTFFIFLNQIIDQVNWSVDKVLLGRISGTAAVAVYGIGGQINSLYMQMSTAISGVFAPEVNRIVAQSDDNRELTRLMVKVGRVQSLILVLAATGFVFFGRPFIRLWAGNGYERAYETALLLLIPVTVPLMQNLGIEIQRAKNAHRVRSVVYAGLAAGNIVLSVILIPYWGCVGAAAGTAVSMIAGNVLFMNWYYHKKIGLDMLAFWKEIAGLLPGWGLACLFGFAVSSSVPLTQWNTLLMAVILYTMGYGAVMWRIGLNAREKQRIRDLFPKFITAGKKKGNRQMPVPLCMELTDDDVRTLSR